MTQKHTKDLKQPCKEWQGALDQDGYGRINVNGKWKLAHRVEYEKFVEPIGNGLVIDHLCRNRSCVNVSHMEIVTNKENVLRGMGVTAQNKRKTTCKNGHLFYTDKDEKRKCLECARKRWREYRLREISKGTWKKS
jgi:hypothetical protein